MKYLMAAHQPENNTILRLQLDDHYFEFPTMEPVEVESDFYAEKLLEVYGHIYGIVNVPYSKGRTGISVDVESAQHAAKAHLKKTETEMLLAWVTQQKEDRVRQNLPVLPPTGRVEEIIRKGKINLQQRFGITPVGMDAADYVDTEKVELKRQLAEAQARLADTNQRQNDLDARMKALESPATKK